MDFINQILEFIHSVLDRSPRMIYHILRSRIQKSKPIENFDDEHPCLFVLSTGRVGTETLANLFGLEKSIFSHHEPYPKLFALSKLAYEMADIFLGDANIKKVLQESFQTSRNELMNYSLACDRGYIETSPQCTFLAPIILSLTPNAKFIHLVRNPNDVVRSGMRRGWYNGHEFDSNRIIPLPDTKFAKMWKSYAPYQKNLWLWAETNRWILDFAKGLSSHNYLLIQAETIFQKDMNTINRLYKFIGKTNPPERKIKAVINKRLNMQRKGEFNPPANLQKLLDDDLKNFVGSVSKKLNYKFD
jgi:hypothetical protein